MFRSNNFEEKKLNFLNYNFNFNKDIGNFFKLEVANKYLFKIVNNELDKYNYVIKNFDFGGLNFETGEKMIANCFGKFMIEKRFDISNRVISFDIICDNEFTVFLDFYNKMCDYYSGKYLKELVISCFDINYVNVFNIFLYNCFISKLGEFISFERDKVDDYYVFNVSIVFSDLFFVRGV